TYSGQVGAASAIEQIITGLTPNTTYTLTGYGKVATSGEIVSIGVKDYGGTDKSTGVSNTAYTLVTLSFTTGATDTSARIYLYKFSGAGLAYGDDFQVVTSGPGPTATPTNTPTSTPTRTNT